MMRSELLGCVSKLRRLKSEIDGCIVDGEARKGRLDLAYPDYFFSNVP